MIPPHDLDLERAILGAVVVRTTALAEICDVVQSRDFYRQAHQRVWEVCCELGERREPVTVSGITGGLMAHGWQQEATTAEIASWMDGVPRSAAVLTLALQLVDLSDRRSMQALCARGSALVANAETAEAAAEQLVEETRAAVRSRTRSGSTMEDSVAEAMVDLDTAPESYSTGFPALDRMGCAFQPGEFVVLAARPGMGKSAMALNLARAVAGAGTTVWFASLEMTRRGLFRRLMATEAGVDSMKLRGTASLEQHEYAKVSDAMGVLGDLPIQIDDYSGIGLSDLRRMVLGQRGLVVVDYLQLMTPPAHTTRYGSRVQEVGALSRGLKALAHDHQVAVLALSQMSRAVEGRSDKEPMLSDLRESGEIEQDTDQVWMLWRPPLYDQRELQDRAVLKVAKHRDGPVGRIELVFEAESTRFRERTSADLQPVNETVMGPEAVGKSWRR